jgi:multidrug efflux pump subunit AcrA (membrane-fusion protein)
MLAAGVGAAVVGTGTAVALAATSGNGPNLRVATVGVGSVDQTVESSGTISSSLKLTPSFPTSGTVASVGVHVGQHVSKGQVLAKLDTTSLQADVDSANSALASAKQQLEADETGQTSPSNNGSSNAASNIMTAAYVTYLAAPSTSISGLIKQVEDAQQAVITTQHDVDTAQPAIDDAQHTVDSDVTQNTKLRDAQQQACATSSTPSPSPSDTSAGGNSGCADAMTAYQASADTLAHDMATLDAKIAAQDGYIKQLDSAITTLDKLVDQLQSAAAHNGSSGSGGSGGSTGPSRPSAPSTGSPSSPNHNRGGSNTPRNSAPSGGASLPNRGGNGNSSGTGNSSSGQNNNGNNGSQGNNHPASAAQLAADQKAIDAAQAELGVAQQNLAAATLTSPATGKVAAVGLTVGQSSAGGTITIVGTGIPGVEATVALAQIDQVKVGESVTVAADGVSTKLHGTVTSIGLLNTTSGTSTAYPVTVQLDAGTPQLYDGTGADIVISTGSAHNVLTVPNSAIHTTVGGLHTVTVDEAGKTTTVPVTLGIAGSDVTEVKSGLKAGQRVVLADPSAPLPASTSNSNNPFGFLPRGAFQRLGR